MPNIPSPRQGECKDSAMPSERTEYERKYITWLGLPEQRRRNVDKQRRRLLAERLERRAQEHADDAIKLYQAVGTFSHMADIERRIARNHNRIDRLRTIAARLRGTE